MQTRTWFWTNCNTCCISQRLEASGRPARAPKQVQRRLTPNQQAKLIARYQAGEKVYELAEAYEVHRSTVTKLLTDAGVRRPRSLTPGRVEEAIALYAHGWSCARIGQHFECDDETVRQTLRRAGVQLRTPWERPGR
jgi:DNA-directed RNA polymerase specialized sigma24 family protein